MFERYTEKARRIIFFARYEASQYGGPYIETPHLLLGMVRESFPTLQMVSGASYETLRAAIEPLCPKAGAPLSTSVDMPLNHSCKRVLTYAAEEAERMGHRHIGPEHLLLGVLREDGPEAKVLHGLGIGLDGVRMFAGPPAESTADRASLKWVVAQIPEERLAAAGRILAGLASEYFTATGESAQGAFSFSFGKGPGGG